METKRRGMEGTIKKLLTLISPLTQLVMKLYAQLLTLLRQALNLLHIRIAGKDTIANELEKAGVWYYGTVKYSTVQVQYGTVRYSMVRYGTVDAVQYSTMVQYRYGPVQYSRCSTVQYYGTVQVRYGTVQ